MDSQKIFPHVKNTHVADNTFIEQKPRQIELPDYESCCVNLPRPFWDGHEDAIKCYDKVWQLAFNNLRNPQPGSGFVSPFISTAFNGFLFMWDSCFILMFARYGRGAFNYQGTLDNFYAMQHEDGFISREMNEIDAEERFERHDPVSTGPNIIGWCEWEYYKNYGDKNRLRKIFPALLAYHNWMSLYRSWPDGSYWSTGWGCGMDNQPRCPKGCDHALHHGFMSWVDATAQALLSAQCILKIGKEINTSYDLCAIYKEVDFLREYINNKMWNDKLGIYTDCLQNGELSNVVTIGGFWPILAGAADNDKTERMLDLLEDPRHFNRPHRIPTLSASHPEYNPNDGGYWRGGVWSPTNYMVLRGLRSLSDPRAAKLAGEIGRNHIDNITKVFNDTKTVWENYAPECATHGHAKADFVGWSGIGPVAVLLEEVFGMQPDIPANRLVLDIRLTDEYGVNNYPFADKGTLDLTVNARKSTDEKPVITIESTVDLILAIHWYGGSQTFEVTAGKTANT